MNKATTRILAVLVILFLVMNRFISLWTGSIAMPDLYGYSEEEVLRWSEEAGIPVDIQYTWFASEDEGICISTNPGSRAVVNSQDTIIVYINRKN